MIGLGLSITQLAVRQMLGGSFNPLDLFANGETGAWYDPSDMSTLFQGAAGTTPVTAVEQPVGLMLDKSRGLVLGPKIVDDNFDSGTSGWVEYTNFIDPAALSTVNGNLRVTTVKSDGSSGAKKLLTGLTAGKWYRATARIKKTTDPSADLATANLRFVNGDATAGWVASFSTKLASFVEATIYFSPTGTTGTLGLVSGGTATAASTYVMEYDDVAVREIAGAHASQATATARSIYRAAPQRLVFDVIDDSHNSTFPASLGSNCTIARAVPGVGASILTGQTVGTTFNNTTTHAGLLVIDRPLTAGEITQLTSYMNEKAGV